MRNPINVPPRMDAVIDYDEAAGFLKNLPSLEPRPNFTNIRALQKHIVQALAQLLGPQSAIHRWSGLAMDPASYLLFEVAAAINQLAANQSAIMSQMAATSTQKGGEGICFYYYALRRQ